MSGSTSPAPQRSRGNPAMADIVRSVGVLGLIVLALWLIGLLQTNTPDDPVKPVEWTSTATSARQAATYPLLAPVSLPDEWRVNGVRFTPGKYQPWHLGVLTDDDRYIGLEQEKKSSEDLLEQYADGAQADGTIDIAGATWQRYEGPEDQITLLQESDEVTTLVTTSTASFEDLERFVDLLSPE